MLTIVCDICQRVIPDKGFTCDLVETRVVPAEEGAPRLIDRGAILSFYLCHVCTGKLQVRIHSLRALAARGR